MRLWSQLKPEERELFIQIVRNPYRLEPSEQFELDSVRVGMLVYPLTVEEVRRAREILHIAALNAV
jgi:hypothetical protein